LRRVLVDDAEEISNKLCLITGIVAETTQLKHLACFPLTAEQASPIATDTLKLQRQKGLASLRFSLLQHETDKFKVRSSCSHRRVTLTMLYGDLMRLELFPDQSLKLPTQIA
jgi:hypothetical protein